MPGPVVLAFGGNVLAPDPSRSWYEEARAEELTAALLRLLPDDSGLVLVHGNGPQVGLILLRVEATRDKLPAEPLDVMVAETQGSIGYLLARSLRNALAGAGSRVEVATVMTQVVVDPADPGFAQPTKPVGPFYPDGLEASLRRRGWELTEVPGRGWRRVVASPHPVEVVELHSIEDAARHGHVVIAGGGGGVPVVREKGGRLRGVEAVIDKDRTAGLLAASLDARSFVILTGVPHASRAFGTDEEEPLPRLSVEEAEALLEAGEFPPGSMGPKVESAARYARRTGRPALITDPEHLDAALAGEEGTRIEP